MAGSFFIPYKGSHYQNGFLGSRVLVVGAHHYCPFECQNKAECMVDSQPFDRSCPVFLKNIEKFGEDYKDYYTLSNDNEVEIDSYIDGAPYPAYSAFTKYMLGIPDYLTKEQKREFWDSVAFYQYTQHYLPDGFTPSYKDEKELFDEDYPAFADAINDLQPEVVFVWNPAVRDCILAHEEKSDTPLLIYKGKTDMQALSVYVFVTPEYDEKKSKKGILSAQHINVVTDKYCAEFYAERRSYAWFAKQVKDIVGHDIVLNSRAKKFDGHKALKRFSNILYYAYEEGLLLPAAKGFEQPKEYNDKLYNARSWAYFKKRLHELFKGNCNSSLPTGDQYITLFNNKNINKNAPKEEDKNDLDLIIDAFFEQFK